MNKFLMFAASWTIKGEESLPILDLYFGVLLQMELCNHGPMQENQTLKLVISFLIRSATRKL